MELLRHFSHQFIHALRNLMPIVVVVVFFQLVIFRSVPADPWLLVIGLLIVAVGIALFLLGLDLSIFPVGKRLSNQFAQRGSIVLMVLFSFTLGFAAVVAEPALISVAQQAEIISEGRINGLTLRIIVALSVAVVMGIGVLRVVFNWPIQWLLIGGYLLVVAITYFAPAEIVGLAYDSGGVTTNIVTVPLVAAIGLGLASSIKGRSPLQDGFGLIALAVMVPMITVQAYGIWVYGYAEASVVQQAIGDEKTAFSVWSVIVGLAELLRDVTPMIIVVVVFQFAVLRQPLANPMRVVVGFAMVVFGLYAFVWGLKLGLFPVGQLMAEQLIEKNVISIILLFAFTIGFATTMAEPALIAVGQQAEQVAPERLKGSVIRILVAVGVAVGITIGVYRIIVGGSMHYYIMAGYSVVILLTLLAPKYIIALAFDLGGVTTSEVTVPLVTALGIGLASAIEGRNVLIDGFGLIAFASIFPMISVLIYGIVTEILVRRNSAAKQAG